MHGSSPDAEGLHESCLWGDTFSQQLGKFLNVSRPSFWNTHIHLANVIRFILIPISVGAALDPQLFADVSEQPEVDAARVGVAI
jgi:hypothetical protein